MTEVLVRSQNGLAQVIETRGHRVEVKDVLVEGKLTEQQLQRLSDIARRCPVQRSLSSDIVVEDSMTGSS